ncbi:alpha/beta fold hydrolase [Prescottella subtropica]|uniref:alpha/beta fold hydrolase n=1 Tax=Prescottella subtropica TaxID=2545757 RepID=UPI0010F8DE8D|nr:alpha/beta hydrolase [Prescottella subtropica]
MTVDVSAPARTGTVRLADGRDLAWSEWGAPEGVPVLLFPGAATTGSLGFGASTVAGLGVRLIALDRPGLGASTMLPGKTFHTCADDVTEFAALRGLGRPAAVGNSQGAPFALACAAAGVVGPLALVSPADEIADPRFADVLPEQLRDLIALTASDPGAAEQVFAAFDADAMWQMVIGASPDSDLAVYRDPGFETAYRTALRDAFAPGPAGYARDTVLAMERWPFDPSAIDAPVDVWFGEQDTSHSPDLGVGLTARIPGARRHIVPGIGGAVLWTHADDILRTLLGR